MAALRSAFPSLFFPITPRKSCCSVLRRPARARSECSQRILSSLDCVVAPSLQASSFLHSGQILVVLLALYFGLFCVLQRWGMNVVREVTASATAAAVFGAILLAGFCLVVFPTT